MSTIYRFHWDYYHKTFETPENLGKMTSSDKKQKMDAIVKRFARESGISPTNGCFFVLLFAALFIGLMLAAYFTLPKDVGKALVIVGPFVAFSCIAYLMCRKTPLVRVNCYLEKFRRKLESEAATLNLQISCQFVKGKPLVTQWIHPLDLIAEKFDVQNVLYFS